MDKDIKIVLIGGTGYVGNALIRNLEQKHENLCNVHALVRGKKNRIRTKVAKTFLGALSSIPRELFPEEPYVVVHFGTKQVDRDNAGFWKNNVEGTRNLMASLTEHCVGVIYGSSMSVYGQGEQIRVKESQNLAPGTALAKSRVEAERIIELEAKTRGCTALILRPRYIVGEGDRYTIPGIAGILRKGISLRNGGVMYSVIDVDDYARIILGLANKVEKSSPIQRSFNVGYRKAISFSAMEKIVIKEINAPMPRMRLPAVKHFIPLIKKLPGRRAASITTKLELLALSHYGNVERLQEFLGDDVLDRDPKKVLAEAVKKWNEGPENA